MAAVHELDDIINIAECPPTQSWYRTALAGKPWEQDLEGATAVDYSRALEEATRSVRVFDEVRRLSGITRQRNSLEDAIAAAKYAIGAAWYKRAESAKAIEDLTRPIEEAIEASRFILSLEENWDEEGSPGYAEATWQRATQFVRDIAKQYINDSKERIEPPKITPGPEGSIDIRWRAEKRTLLINFSAGENEPADFFGSDRGEDTIKGTLDISSQNLWLLLWLTR